MRFLKDRKVRYITLILSLILVYSLGFIFFALDRETVYSWINIIQYLTIVQIFAIILATSIAAYYFSLVVLPERAYVPLLLLFAIMSLVPFFGLTQAESDFLLHYDAARHIQRKGVIAGLDTLGNLGYHSPPFLAIMQGTSFRLFGEGYLQAEMLQRLFFILLPLVVFLLGRELWNSRVGFHAGLLVIATPSILQQNYLFMQDIPVTFFTILFAYLLLKSDANKLYTPLAVSCALVAITVKNSGGLYVFLIFISILWLKISTIGDLKLKRTKIIKGIIFTSLVAIFIASMQSTVGQTIIAKVYGLILSYPRRVFTLSGAVPITSVFFQIGFAQSLLAIAALYPLWHNRDKRSVLLISWIVVPTLLLWGTRVRYLMPVFPAVSLFVAAGVEGFDERLKKSVIYVVVMIMLLLTTFSSPQIVNNFVFNNIMSAAKETNNLDVETVGVYTKYAYPWMKELPTVSAVDYYSDKRIEYLGFPEVGWRQRAGGGYILPEYYYPTTDTNRIPIFYWVNQTKTPLDVTLENNYSLMKEWTGGSYYYHDPYYVKLYTLKQNASGPTDAIIYASNVKFDATDIYNFWDQIRHVEYPQAYKFGPIQIASTYGVYVEDWLGERQLFVKPPDVGQMNATYFVVVPENSSLSFSISLRPDTWHWLKGDGVRFRVLVDGDVLLDRYLDPKHNEAERGLFHYRFPLGRYSGRNATFVFQTFSGPGNDSRWDTAGFGDPAVVWGF